MSLLARAKSALAAPAAPAAPAAGQLAQGRAGLFKGMKDAKFNAGGNYMEANHTYDLEVSVLRVFNDRNGKLDIFVGDFIVLGTTSDSPQTKPGSTVNYYTDDKEGREMWLGNIKALMVAIYGSVQGEPVSADSIGEDEAEALMGMPTDANGVALPGGLPGTMSRGVRIRCQTRGIITKVKKTPFTVHNWFPVFEGQA